MNRSSHSEVTYSSSVPTPTSFCLLKDFRYPYVVVEAGPSEEEEEEGEEEDSLVVLKIDNEACEVTEVTRIRVTGHTRSSIFISPYLIYLEESYNPSRNVILIIYDIIEKKNICEKDLGGQVLNMKYFDGKLFLDGYRRSVQHEWIQKYLQIYDFKGMLNIQRENASESRISLIREIEIEPKDSRYKCFFNKTSFIDVNVKKRGLEFKEIDFWRIK